MKKQHPKKVTLRQRQKTETYQLILKSARHLLETEGYKKTTIRKIADHAGIGLGTLYKHFSQKTAVLFATFCDDIGGTLDRAIKEFPSGLSLKEELMFLASRFFAFYEENQKLARVYVREVAFETGEGREENDKLDERFLLFIKSRVDEAKKRGEARQELDGYLVGTAFFYNYLMTVGYCFFREPAFSMQQAVSMLDSLTELLIEGVSPKTQTE